MSIKIFWLWHLLTLMKRVHSAFLISLLTDNTFVLFQQLFSQISFHNLINMRLDMSDLIWKTEESILQNQSSFVFCLEMSCVVNLHFCLSASSVTQLFRSLSVLSHDKSDRTTTWSDEDRLESRHKWDFKKRRTIYCQHAISINFSFLKKTYSISVWVNTEEDFTEDTSKDTEKREKKDLRRNLKEKLTEETLINN